jgi:hypothetical protein
MASQTSSRKKAIPLAAFVSDIDRRRAEPGAKEVPRNSGVRRTESKQALLEAIEDTGGCW